MKISLLFAIIELLGSLHIQKENSVIDFFQRLIRDIKKGKNLEYYTILFLIIVILIVDIFNLASFEVLTNITLAVLALVVYSLLNTKQGFDELSDKIVKPQGADAFFWKAKNSVEDRFSRAKHIEISGAVLSRTLRDYRAVLEDRLRAGASIRIILMDPKSTAPDQAVLRSKGISDRQFYLDTLRPTIERVGVLGEISEHIELGLVPYKPAYGMILIDPDEAHGSIIVEMYPHHSDSFAPTFELFPVQDPHWHRFFRTQFISVWERCRHFKGKEIMNLIEQMRGSI